MAEPIKMPLGCLKQNSKRKKIAAKWHVVDCDIVIQPLICSATWYLLMQYQLLTSDVDIEALACARNFTTSTSNIWIIFLKRWCHSSTLGVCEGLKYIIANGGTPHRYLGKEVNQISGVPVKIDVHHEYSVVACYRQHCAKRKPAGI